MARSGRTARKKKKNKQVEDDGDVEMKDSSKGAAEEVSDVSDMDEEVVTETKQEKEAHEVEAAEVSSDEDEDDEQMLEIPIRDEEGNETDQVVQFPLSSIPPPDHLLNVLRAETAALHRWLTIAVEYYKRGEFDHFEQLMDVACSAETASQFPDDLKGQVRLLNSFAAYKISRAKGRKKEDTIYNALLTDAVDLFERADGVLKDDSLTLVNKGVLSLVRTEDKNALAHFEQALEKDPRNLLAELGRGVILFNQRKFAEARDCYKAAIRKHPGCGPDVRVNLGLCYYEMGNRGRAMECFERALDMDEDHTNALVAAAVIELGMAQKQQFDLQLSQSALQKLRRAYDLQNENSLMLIHLANHFFFRKDPSDHERDYDRIMNLAVKAFRTTTLDRIKAEATYIMGRCHHEQGDFTVAEEFYDRSLKEWPDFTLCQFAKAQMLLHKSDKTLALMKHSGSANEQKRKDAMTQARDEALKLLEKIMRSPEHKHDRDTCMFAAWMHLRMNHRELAMNLLRQITQDDPQDTDAWMEQARVLQKQTVLVKKQKREALRAYTKAASGMGGAVPHLIYNNVGELRFSLKDTKGALDAFRSGLEHHNEDLEPVDEVTLKFNLARVLEDVGDFDEAETLYNELHGKLPGYTEPLIRLGVMAERHGRYTEAESFFERASKTKTCPDDAMIYLGRLFERRGDLKRAQKYYKEVGKGEKSKVDAYARLSLSNLAFEAARKHRSDRKAFKENSEYAKGWYRKILERNHQNIYAANGLAMTMAMDGHSKEARQIFERLREPDDAANPSVWLNLAHVSVQDGRHETAISLYQQCIKRFKMERNSSALLYLANAFMVAGKYDEARSTLLRAIHVDPADLKLRFNLASLLIRHGIKVCDDPAKLTLTDVLRAVAGFENAAGIYEWLAQAQPRAKPEGDDDEAKDKASKPSKPPKPAKFLQEPRSPIGAPKEANKSYFAMNWKEALSSDAAAQVQAPPGDEDRPPCRRSMVERAPRDEHFSAVKSQSAKNLAPARKYHQGSGRFVDLVRNRESTVRLQLQKLETERARLDEDLQRKEVERKERELQFREEKAKMFEEQLQIAEEVVEVLAKKQTTRTRKGGKKKAEEQMVEVEEVHEGDSGEDSSSSSESDADAAAEGDDYVDNGNKPAKPNKLVAKGKSKGKRKLAKGKEGDDDSSSSSSSSSESSEDEKAGDGDNRGIQATATTTANGGDDSAAKRKAEEAATRADGEGAVADPASGNVAKKPKVMQDSDGENEMDF